MSRIGVAVACFAAFAMLNAEVSSGQNYPSKPIHIVTSPPGGGGDLYARVIAQGISGPMGEAVIVDNRQVNVAPEFVARSPADGYTTLVLGGILWLTPLLQKTSYDPITDLAPITLLSTQPNILVVNASLPVKSVPELIAYAKAKPGTLNYGTSGIGGSPHLAAEMLKSMAGVNIVGVNYKAAGPAMSGLLAGDVQIGFFSATSVAPFLKAGSLRALAITSAKQSSLLPDYPTIASSGLTGYSMENRTAMFAAGKTPSAIVARLNQEVVRVLGTPEVKDVFLKSGSEIVGSSPAELTSLIKEEMTLVGKIIKDAGIHVE